MIRVTANAEQVSEAIRVLGVRAPYAIAVGINKTARGIRAEAVRIVKHGTVSKSSYVRRAVRIRPHATHEKLRAIVTGAGKDIPIIQLGARMLLGGGVSWRAKGKFPRHLPHAFIVRFKSGKRHAVVRAPTATPQQVDHIVLRHHRVNHGHGTPDKPISIIVAPGIGRTLSKPSTLRSLEERGDELFPRRILEALRYELRKRGLLDE